jgi:hypothetical protein
LYNLTRFRLRDDRVIQIVETYQRLRDVAPAPPPALTFTR